MTTSFESIWDRIGRHTGQVFHTMTGLPFTYRLASPRQLRVTRDGKEINRGLSYTNFEQAHALMPASGPAELKGIQGMAYTWAILMDRRIRQSDW